MQAAQGSDAEAAFQKASAAHRAGRLKDAEALYRDLLVASPAHADGLHQLGALLVQSRGAAGADEAAALLRRAVRAAPAVARYRRSLGIAMEAVQRWDDAADAYRRALEKQPADAAAALRLARVLKAAGRPAAAAEAYRALLRLRPTHPSAHYKLGSVLKQLGRHADAADAYRAHLRLHPGHGPAAFWLAALSPTSQRCSSAGVPANMVASLFDHYADHFDEHLVDKLQYRTPSALMDALLKAISSVHDAQPSACVARWERCADLGCGTGLMGALLRPHVRHLAGVDLSPGMVAKAAQRGCYDELAVAELLQFLAPSGDTGKVPPLWDLLLAADVFVYVGDLTPVLLAAADAAAPGCLFAFSTELLEEDREQPQQLQGAEQGPQVGFQLNPTGRFAHSKSHIAAAAAAGGWRLLELRATVIRTNAGRPVTGSLAVLQRGAGTSS